MMSSSRYFFVSKDTTSESFSKSDDKERRLIHRHVQIDHIRRQSAATDLNNHLPFIEVFPGVKQNRRQKSIDNDSNQSTASTSALSINPRLPCRCFTNSTK